MFPNFNEFSSGENFVEIYLIKIISMENKFLPFGVVQKVRLLTKKWRKI